MAVSITAYNQTFLIPESDDPCVIWKSYFLQLKKEVGTANARTLWLVTWKENGGVSCLTSPGFQKWLQNNKIDVSNAATRTIADFSEIGGNILGLGKNMTRLIAIGVPVVVLAALIGIVIILRNTTKDTDANELLRMLTPAGKGLKLLRK